MAAHDAEPAAKAHVAYMAGGCFWGLERAMQNVDGVTDTTVGYAQSNTPNPTYRQVCSGATGAVETVRIAYDPERVSLRTLTLLFLDIIDPFSVDRQGNDVGAQYRSGLYPAGERAAEQRVVYEEALAQLAQRAGHEPAVEVEQLRNFTPAEPEHQDYLLVNPGGYCHIPVDVINHMRERQRYIERIWSLTPNSMKSRSTPPQRRRSATNTTVCSNRASMWTASVASRCSSRPTNSIPDADGRRSARQSTARRCVRSKTTVCRCTRVSKCARRVPTAT